MNRRVFTIVTSALFALVGVAGIVSSVYIMFNCMNAGALITFIASFVVMYCFYGIFIDAVRDKPQEDPRDYPEELSYE